MRSLLITRRRPDQRSHLWAQRLKTRALLATPEAFTPWLHLEWRRIRERHPELLPDGDGAPPCGGP